jgi:hypothetical protein
MIALEKQHIAPSPAPYQQVNNLSRVRPAIDVVAEENLEEVGGGACLEIVVYAHEKVGQEIGAPVYVADGIDAPTGGDAWLFGAANVSPFPRQDLL